MPLIGNTMNLSDEPEWIEIPAGPFLMGSTREQVESLRRQYHWDWPARAEQPQREVDLPTYYIAKYPVTVAQYTPFVESDSYTNHAYWTDAGWQWRLRMNKEQPEYWRDPKWHIADHPVVGVSWYEAYAYCWWLSAQVGYEVKLPTEAEWEKAARGTDGRIYPWGNEFDVSKCNTKRIGISRTTPVGKYSSQGDSPYGCTDMIGNVAEWCLTKWQEGYYISEDNTTTGQNPRVLRGGSFDFKEKRARAAARYYLQPDTSAQGIGFRPASPYPFP
jgi:formylglycine-generating enzyme required for sulfatase activity